MHGEQEAGEEACRAAGRADRQLHRAYIENHTEGMMG
ncbi:hypothetical protein GGC63_003566 [Paenibacillus sp. OAS669]|nr:hypothetical protein [Paenibacillus sp. OAS669]